MSDTAIHVVDKVAVRDLFPTYQYQSRLYITPTFCVAVEKPMPGMWRRFWYWALLGWTWKAATP
ncbi:MAG: hypothetical protein K2R98_19400 [Gemmataceae bacterium]|nr:hypothetical protein [Gemmataceae bacterium]